VRSIRLSILALAILGCAWFVLGIRQAHETARATAIIARRGVLTATELSNAASLLRSARVLNPDAEVEILRGRLTLAANHPRRAMQILEAVARDEPLNLEAWVWLAGVALGDPPEARVAVAHINRLDPLASHR
jgi:predicted Zn-dependent protease